jgi:hypothetical protein
VQSGRGAGGAERDIETGNLRNRDREIHLTRRGLESGEKKWREKGTVREKERVE